MNIDIDQINTADDVPAKRPHATPFNEIAQARLSRRAMLGGISAAALTGFWGVPKAHASASSGLSVTGLSPDLRVADGLTFDVVARWGDPILSGAPAFAPTNLSATAQAQQFGDCADFTAFRPLNAQGTRGLLAVNHEFSLPQLKLEGFDDPAIGNNADYVAFTQNAIGMSVVEIAQNDGTWGLTPPGRYNRRITAANTPCQMAGPAAGHKRLHTAASAGGTLSHGTFGNCAGGVTPWGTVLTAEENIQFYYQGDPAKSGAEQQNHARMGVDGTGPWAWGQHDPRFNLEETPNGPNLMGWIVEIDPYNPDRPPIKHTALGRFKHEGAGVTVNADGRIVVYMGDDQKFEYIYRFVSKGRLNSKAHAIINSRLLDDGTLSVAEFTEDEIIWHDLVQGQGPLTAANGFHSQADVVIEARRAADLMGATPMDRPEDVEVNSATGHVFAMLTNNTDRGYFEDDAANPRGPNLGGHVIEMIPPQDSKGVGDHTAPRFTWDIFLKGGPKEGLLLRLAGQLGEYHPDTAKDQWLGAPDNCTFTQAGDIVIATDGMEYTDISDGLFLMPTQGPNRAKPRRLIAAPQGSEVCGPTFTPDEKTLFCSIQHPGMGSDLAAPSTRFPDFDESLPPRSSVVAIRHVDGKPIA
ncbi:MAG: PhoX family protein [Alphaproteobacteria bacterium]